MRVRPQSPYRRSVIGMRCTALGALCIFIGALLLLPLGTRTARARRPPQIIAKEV